MPLGELTFDEIRDSILARKALEEPGLDTSSAGDAWIDANAQAYLIMEQQADLVAAAAQQHPTTASGAQLNELGRVWLGEGRRAATKWEGSVSFTATAGTPVIPINTVFTHADGTAFKTTTAVSAGTWISGVATVLAESTTLGAVATKTNGTECNVSSPPSGVSSVCTIASTTTASVDAEDEEQYRARILVASAYRPGGGNPASYVEWAMTVPGVTAAFVYPRWDDDPTGPPVVLGTVTVVPWGPSGDRVVDAATVALVQAKCDLEAPVGAVVTVEAPTQAVLEFVDVYLRPRPGYEPDFAGSFEVASCASPYTRVTLTTDPTGTIAVGDRVLVPVAIYPAGLYQRTVAAVGANYFDVTVPLPGAAVTGDDVFAGSDCTQDVIDALNAHFDTLGPSASTDATRPRFPSENTVNPSKACISDMYYAIEGVEGVASSRIDRPTADEDISVAPGATILALYLGNLKLMHE